jgi:hypothetical protein
LGLSLHRGAERRGELVWCFQPWIQEGAGELDQPGHAPGMGALVVAMDQAQVVDDAGDQGEGGSSPKLTRKFPNNKP